MRKKVLLTVLAGLLTIMCMEAKEKTTTGGVPVVKLNNGVEMPRFGLGTFLMSPQQCKEYCLLALKAGYRHIDTAHAYGNEVAVCEAVKESDIPREQTEQIVERLKPRDVSPEAKTIINLSRNKWTWMADKNVAELAKLFHEEAVFVHMGGYWGTKQELETIEKGFIHYKDAAIEREEEVRFADNTATLNSAIKLTAVVGGREVITPFFVTEVYVKQADNSWKLSVLAFTSRPQMPARQ